VDSREAQKPSFLLGERQRDEACDCQDKDKDHSGFHGSLVGDSFGRSKGESGLKITRVWFESKEGGTGGSAHRNVLVVTEKGKILPKTVPWTKQKTS
jgi:hypothetical protein